MNKKKWCPNWAQAGNVLAKLLQALILCLDDLLLIIGGYCLISAAWEGFGRPAGLAAAGICLWFAAWIIARSRRGGSS